MVTYTCDRCGKNFPKLWKLRHHQGRQYQYRLQIFNSNIQPQLPKYITEVRIPILQNKDQKEPQNEVEQQDAQKNGTYLSIEDLANWLVNPKIKNNLSIINKKIPKTDAEWFDLMKNQAKRKSPNKSQKKTKISHQSKVDSKGRPGPLTQAHKKETINPEFQEVIEYIHFEECPVGRDLERSHRNHSLMSK